eukprot:TRINITY_DN8449_c0_g1_i1.p1 TRINITY_DN8449_c0_g1~~TRINITY_DN8449_c0_g1_i1.p1  ORF type:complete len:315 (+),score=53.36 TRINITY_DN8449_c0_g1_i1:44-988(+)
MSEMATATRTDPLSQQAQDFLNESNAATWQTVDLSPSGLLTLRAENTEVAAPGCLAVLSEVKATTKEDIIAGVPVIWVIPQQLRGDEIVMYMFGGGFVCGCPEDDIAITARLADKMGRSVCVPRYRLAPEHPYPAARDDVIGVYRALCGVDEIVVVGESAGGNLALGLVLDLYDEGLILPLAVGLLSPWIDLTHSGESHQCVDLDPTLSVEHFLTPASIAYAGNYEPGDAKISPLFADIPTNFPATTISTGTRDLLPSDCVRLANKLRECNTTVDIQTTEGMWHVYEWLPQLPESSISMEHIANFLSKYTKDKY